MVVIPSGVVLAEEAVAAIDRYRSRGGSVVSCCDAAQHRLPAAEAPLEPHPHSYMRIEESGRDHPLYDGFDDTDIIAGGRWLTELVVDDADVVGTWIPDYPVNPTHVVYMDPERTDVPNSAAGPVETLRPLGPQTVSLALAPGEEVSEVGLLREGNEATWSASPDVDGVQVSVASVKDFEVVAVLLR